MLGMIAMAGVTAYSQYEANKAADARADAANANNEAAAAQSRLLAERDNRIRQEELLRRFNIKADKIKDSALDVKQSTAINLSNLDMEVLKAKSVTDNVTASRHIEGRLAERLHNIINIKDDINKGTTIQNSEQSIRTINEKLDAMRMDLESEQLNVNIDYNNAINQANNNEIRNITYSSSSGTLGVVTSGISGLAQGATLESSYYNMEKAQNIYQTNQKIGGIH